MHVKKKASANCLLLSASMSLYRQHGLRRIDPNTRVNAVYSQWYAACSFAQDHHAHPSQPALKIDPIIKLYMPCRISCLSYSPWTSGKMQALSQFSSTVNYKVLTTVWSKARIEQLAEKWAKAHKWHICSQRAHCFGIYCHTRIPSIMAPIVQRTTERGGMKTAKLRLTPTVWLVFKLWGRTWWPCQLNTVHLAAHYWLVGTSGRKHC